MAIDKKQYKDLLEKIEKLNPLIVKAIDDVDDSLLDEFRKLSINEKIRRASEGKDTLDRFHK